MSRFKLPPLSSAPAAFPTREADPVAPYCENCQGFGYTRKGAEAGGWLYCTACRGAQRRPQADYEGRR